MGSLILCHKKRARQPYVISRVHMKIYTIEELCYYICNNLYLIDYTIINQQLCDWIGRELDMEELSEHLREELRKNCSMEQFILTILRESTIYAQSDINRIQNILERLQNQKDVERKKHKADSLMLSKEYESAVLVYQSIIHGERDDSVDKTFYGKVYACLGAAYGRLFLYEEAARMYEQAYAICEDADMLKAYLYCCSRALPEQKYVKMLSGNPAYLTMDPVVRESVQTVRREIDPDLPEEKLEQWEKEYRRIDKTAGIC